MWKVLVQVRVVDQALPADHRPRLLEIDAHGDQQLARDAGPPPLRRSPAILHRRRGVVDGAGADHHQQPVVAPPT
jgi:hypothetical protein